MEYKVEITTQGEPLFLNANNFCRDRYQDCGILEKGQHFSSSPDLYFVALSDQNQIVGTIGAFCKNSCSLLPFEEVFSYRCAENAVELGRFSLYTGVQRRPALTLIRLLFKEMLRYFRNQSRDFFVETHSTIIALFQFATGCKDMFWKIQEAAIQYGRIPLKSLKFYRDMDPKIFRINPALLSSEAPYPSALAVAA